MIKKVMVISNNEGKFYNNWDGKWESAKVAELFDLKDYLVL